MIDSSHAVHSGREHCLFECGGQVFATDLAVMREVLSGKLATPVPQAPPALVGVVDLYGEVLPVVQLSTLLGLRARPYTPANPIRVLIASDTKIGVAVDRVRQVRPIDPDALTSATHKLYRGWCATSAGPPIAVLNTEALVAHAVQTVASQIQGALPDPSDSHLRRKPFIGS